MTTLITELRAVSQLVHGERRALLLRAADRIEESERVEARARIVDTAFRSRNQIMLATALWHQRRVIDEIDEASSAELDGDGDEAA